ncbi:TetR/AcrR family transcriptional regulator [Salipiger pentaromativorans]|uniref:TetR/AcrR family transcriptional regulator n=1 Tax=Salipiger pentaromativorans TaxID=2943193 RepID=UPI0021571C73
MAILEAAFEQFAAYGYRRTSMEDIARAAGMSRPALYMHFAGKEAILRALVGLYYARLGEAVAQALARTGPPEAVLEAALACHAAAIPAAVLRAPHGEELLDSTSAICGDVFQEGEARLAERYVAWLTREAAAGRLRLEEAPALVAETLLAAAKGAKRPPYEAYPERLRLLARMIGRGLRA